MHIFTYSRLSLSRVRLYRITAYLDGVKIWFLVSHGNLTTDNKILWKRGDIAQGHFLPFSTGAISPLFHNIFYISLPIRVKIHIHLLNVIFRFIFSRFCKSDTSRYGYLKLFQRVPWTLGLRESTISVCNTL